MNYRYLGKTGLKISELCLGAMTFGRETEEAASHAMLDRFAEAGGNFIDTADVYSQGRSEEMVGGWLKDKSRDDFVIATKVRFPMGENPNDAGLSRISPIGLAHCRCPIILTALSPEQNENN